MVTAQCKVSGSDSSIAFAVSNRLTFSENFLKEAQKSDIVGKRQEYENG